LLVSRIAALLKSDIGRWLGLTALFSVAAVVQTWPLVLHAGTKTTASQPIIADSWVYLWDLWWMKHAIVELHTNPFHTDFLFFPDGTDLYFHTLAVTQSVLSIPLQIVTGNLFLSWNLLALSFFVASALGMYAVVNRITHSQGAALISGYIFAFSPFVLMRFTGHWHMSTTWPIPLMILFLLRFLDTGRFREAAGAGVCWGLITYNFLEYGMDAGIFLLLFFTYWSLIHMRRRDRVQLLSLWRGGVVLAVTWLVVTAPLVLPALVTMQEGDVLFPSNDEYWSSDVLAFVTPSPLWGPGLDPKPGGGINHVTAGSIENTVFLGFVPLILAALAFFRLRKRPHATVFWAIVLLFFLTLTLGPYLYVGQTKSFSLLGFSFSIPLPYQLLDQLPVVGDRRAPARMAVFGIVALSILAGVGFTELTSIVKQRMKGTMPLLTVLILGLIVVEYWNPPTQLTGLTWAPVLEDIGKEPGDFTVLQVPWGRVNGWTVSGDSAGAVTTNFYQTIYQKRSFGGFVSRTTDRDLVWVGQKPGLRYLACSQCEAPNTPEDSDPNLVRSVLRDYRVKYVLLLRFTPDGHNVYATEAPWLAVQAYLRDVAGLRLVDEDADLMMYLNPDMQDQ